MTTAGTLSVYEIVAVSATPSPFGVTVGGSATSARDRERGLAGADRADRGRQVGRHRAMAYLYEPGTASEASHVQSTVEPRPLVVATKLPAASSTSIVHGSGDERRARKRTRPGTVPVTAGAYSFGSPIAATLPPIALRMP